MPEIGDQDQDDIERMAAQADILKDGWSRTLEDMRAMAAELREEGWDVVDVGAGDTAPESPDAGRTDRFGLVHVIPGNEADAFAEAFREDGFETYEVFRAEVEGQVFQVTQLLDEETDTAILLAGQYELRRAAPLVNAALEAGEMYTHVQTLDTTHLGSFRHEDVERFFPNPDRFEDYGR